MTDNPYEVLGVARDADDETIQKAYRDLAKKTHPDAGGDGAEFLKVDAAYCVLKDPARRPRYDTTGDAADDNRAQQIESNALALIADVVGKVICGKSTALCKHDFVHMIGEMIKEDRHACALRHREGSALLEQARNVAERITAKPGASNVMSTVVMDHATRLAGQLAYIDLALKVRDRALEIVGGHGFKVDQPVLLPQPMAAPPHSDFVHVVTMEDIVAGVAPGWFPFGPRKRARG